METNLLSESVKEKTEEQNRYIKFIDSVNGLSIAEAKDFIDSAFRRIQNRTVINLDGKKLDF